MGHVSEHHEATDGLVKLLTKANHDLTVVQHRLEREFQQIYPENANPMKLVSRIKKIQEELSTLEEQCRELLSAKQDLIDQARTTLVGNRNLVQRMEASMGISPNTDSEDSAFANFNQVSAFWIIDEWTVQVRSKTGDEKHDSDSEDINQLLFSAIV
ncbi:PREDICTED: spindle and kinetochore-associated [Prunus dulcis]|uniref:Protein FAM33A n=1 Tax=Prunus dulcis TaxID=3755 RepID=A0A5E4E760_PRUDU|nr:PREDICTED: spindle and kinetochore-associated [Prunus dulcis]